MVCVQRSISVAVSSAVNGSLQLKYFYLPLPYWLRNEMQDHVKCFDVEIQQEDFQHFDGGVF